MPACNSDWDKFKRIAGRSQIILFGSAAQRADDAYSKCTRLHALMFENGS